MTGYTPSHKFLGYFGVLDLIQKHIFGQDKSWTPFMSDVA